MAPRPQDVSAALARADAAYIAIPAFAVWAPSGLDLSAWDEAEETFDERRQAATADDVDAALHQRLRAAAVDTGAIEGLYTTDRGFTLSVAQQTISMDQAEVEKGGDFRSNFEAQLEGFELALDAATSATTVTEAFIRRLHEVTCAGQRSYRVLTPVGVQERQLATGAYKSDPNHVQLGDGSFHAYAPVDRVADEMHRLVDQLRSPAFEAAHPVVQAAYAHHGLTWIHPFPDGNGRVARLLASIWLLRAASIPLWIETTDRADYLDALAVADSGNTEPIVDLVLAVSLRLLRDLGLALGYPAAPPGPPAETGQPDPLAVAQRAVRERLKSQLDELVPGVVEMPTLRLTWPNPEQEVGDYFLSLSLPKPVDRPHEPYADLRLAAVALGPEPRHDALRVLGTTSADDHPIDLQESFAFDEVVPRITVQAERRLQAIAEVMARRVSEEAERRG